MPIYDYLCNGCSTTYDVFHKVREVADDIVCPACGSTQHTRLISAPSVNLRGQANEAPPCDGPGCCGGACGLN